MSVFLIVFLSISNLGLEFFGTGLFLDLGISYRQILMPLLSVCMYVWVSLSLSLEKASMGPGVEWLDPRSGYCLLSQVRQKHN